MYDYYKSLPGYISVVANICLFSGIIMLFINFKVAIVLVLACPLLWFIAAHLHKIALKSLVSEMESGFEKSAAKVAKYYNSPEGISDLRAKGFSEDMIKSMQQMAEHDAQHGVFSDD